MWECMLFDIDSKVFVAGNMPNDEFKIIMRGIATLNYFCIFNH
jgi:hypothetical protein